MQFKKQPLPWGKIAGKNSGLPGSLRIRTLTSAIPGHAARLLPLELARYRELVILLVRNIPGKDEDEIDELYY